MSLYSQLLPVGFQNFLQESQYSELPGIPNGLTGGPAEKSGIDSEIIYH